MSFLFKARQKTPAELTRATKENLLKIDGGIDAARKVGF
jgi:hypothetical protein